jgi:hypothetical protein
MTEVLSDRALLRALGRLNDSFSIDSHTRCWTWLKQINKDGYGRFYYAKRECLAHRAAYEILVGPVPAGLELDHLCRNRSCVNPDHLEPVTHRENLLRGSTGPAQNAAKTHCMRGHEFTAENTRQSAANKRSCKECEHLRYQERRDRMDPQRAEQTRNLKREVRRREEARRLNPKTYGRARQTHCVNGHEYTLETTGVGPGYGRFCKECRRIRGREKYRRKTVRGSAGDATASLNPSTEPQEVQP